MKKNRTIPLTLLLSALAATPAGASAVPGASASVLQTMQQQTSACKGVVKDTNGETLIGVSVVVKGTTNGTVTGLDGDFAINGVKKGQPPRSVVHRFYFAGSGMERHTAQHYS